MTTSIQVEVSDGEFGLWSHIFQGANNLWRTDQRIISGNFFLGLQAQTSQIFAAGIPRGAIIESAVMRVTAFQTSGAAAYTTNINTPARGTRLQNRPLINPISHFIGWTKDSWSNAGMTLNSNTATLIVTTNPAATNASWAMRFEQASTSPLGITPSAGRGHRERLAQGFTMPAVGNTTIGSLTAEMFRTNPGPAGNVRAHVYPAILDGGVLVPDESGGPLATSDDVAIAAIPVAAGPVVFPFTGGDQIALTVGNDYFLVIEPDAYVINSLNHISLRHHNQFLETGRLMHYGEGIGGDWGNYPGTIDVNQAVAADEAGTAVLWNIPQFIAGNNYFTPSLTDLVQQQVNDDNYGEDLAIIINTSRNIGGNPNRIWRSANAVAGSPPRLDVTYRRRRVTVG